MTPPPTAALDEVPENLRLHSLLPPAAVVTMYRSCGTLLHSQILCEVCCRSFTSYRIPPRAEGRGEDGRAVFGVSGLQTALPHRVDGKGVDAVGLKTKCWWNSCENLNHRGNATLHVLTSSVIYPVRVCSHTIPSKAHESPRDPPLPGGTTTTTPFPPRPTSIARLSPASSSGPRLSSSLALSSAPEPTTYTSASSAITEYACPLGLHQMYFSVHMTAKLLGFHFPHPISILSNLTS